MDENAANLCLINKKRKRSNLKNKKTSLFYDLQRITQRSISENHMKCSHGNFHNSEISFSKNKKDTKKKFKSLCSNYLQDNKLFQSYDDSNGGDKMKDAHDEYLIDPVSDRNVTKLSKAVEDLKLMKYGEGVRKQLQKQFNKSNDAYQELCHGEKVATPFSEQVTPVDAQMDGWRGKKKDIESFLESSSFSSIKECLPAPETSVGDTHQTSYPGIDYNSNKPILCEDIKVVEDDKFVKNEMETQTKIHEEHFDASSLFFESILEATRHLESGSCDVPVWDFGKNFNINKLLQSPKHRNAWPW